ncbi:hypothetical protein V1264_016706 [Littorina saxatilis]|uniref:Uncharacterized protein n=1 Tax=Littorina saxatilis TaxID=31220 RepID=A0AAN9GFW6_9CAEN
MARQRIEKVTHVLSIMAAAGKQKLQAHAEEHLPGGLYFTPSESAVQAGQLLGTATNDIVESGFGQLDRQQTMNPQRNPVNTSAIVCAKRDKPVAYVLQQDAAIQELMVATARKSGAHARKEAGTKENQLLKVWRPALEERREKADTRCTNRAKKHEQQQDIINKVMSGKLMRTPDVTHHTGPALMALH